MLRRVSRSLIPLSIRAVRAPRTFHGTVSGIVSPGKYILLSEINRASSLRFSTLVNPSSDEDLDRIIDFEIECAQHSLMTSTLPTGFPFRIRDNPGESTILLEREYRDETITVKVDMPTRLGHGDIDDEEGNEGKPDDTIIPMVVTISKGSGFYLEVGATASLDEMTIDSLSLKDPEASEEQLLYEGPEINDLDEHFQKAIWKYLGVRGINMKMANLLQEYMANKDNEEYLNWLKNLKDFVL